MRPQLGALVDYAAHLVERQIGAVAVFGGPAALAVQVAGARRVKEDNERDVALVFLSVCSYCLGAVDSRAEAESEQHILDNPRVALVDDIHREVVPDIALILDRLAECVKILLGESAAHKFLRYVYQLQQIFLRLLFDILKNAVERDGSRGSLELFFCGHHKRFLPLEIK